MTHAKINLVKTIFLTTMLCFTASAAQADACATPPTCTTTQASRWDGAQWQCVNAGPSFGDWQAVTVSAANEASGTASTDGFLVVTTPSNTSVTGYTSNVQRFFIAGRDKYGQGPESMMMPVKRGETWKITGAKTVWFMSVNN